MQSVRNFWRKKSTICSQSPLLISLDPDSNLVFKHGKELGNIHSCQCR
jgi:hypothetical protein